MRFYPLISILKVCCSSWFVFLKKAELISDCGLRIADCGLRISDCGLGFGDWGLRIADWGLRIADCGLGNVPKNYFFMQVADLLTTNFLSLGSIKRNQIQH